MRHRRRERRAPHDVAMATGDEGAGDVSDPETGACTRPFPAPTARAPRPSHRRPGRARALGVLMLAGPLLVVLLALGLGVGGMVAWVATTGNSVPAVRVPEATVAVTATTTPVAVAPVLPVAGSPIVPEESPTTRREADDRSTDRGEPRRQDEGRGEDDEDVRSSSARPSRSPSPARPARPGSSSATAPRPPSSAPAEPAPPSAPPSVAAPDAPPADSGATAPGR